MNNFKRVAIFILSIFIFNLIMPTAFTAMANPMQNQLDEVKDTNNVTNELELQEGNIDASISDEIDNQELEDMDTFSNELELQQENIGIGVSDKINNQQSISYYYQNPTNNHKLTGDFLVKGWVSSKNGIEKVEVIIGDNLLGIATLDILDANNRQKFTYKVSGVADGNHNVKIKITDKSGQVIEESRNIIVNNTKTPIMGKGTFSASKMRAFLHKYNPNLGDIYVDGFVNHTIEEARIEGVNHDILFAQMMLETGYLKFGNDVSFEQNNFAGIGATGGGNPGHSFPTVQIGIRAVVQHLKAYASTDELVLQCVDPRFKYVRRGSAVYLEHLGIQENPEGLGWASGHYYGEKIKNIMTNINNTSPEPVSQANDLKIEGALRIGNQLKITAIATPSENSEYKFWIFDKQKKEWTVLRDYSSSNTIMYTPTKVGDFSFVVHVKHKSSTAAYDSRYEVEVSITDKEYSTVESFNVTGDTFVGSEMILKANSYPSDSTLYKFWVFDEQKREWTVIRDYSKNNTFSYRIQEPGNYSLVVHVKNEKSDLPYDDRAEVKVTIKDYQSSGSSLIVEGERYVGNKLSLKASANPAKDTLYKFWVYDKQKNEWTIIRDYNSKNTFSYAIQEPGQYSLVVHTKHRLSKKAYDDRAEVIVNITEKIYSSSSTSLIVEGERYAGNKLSLKASANPASDTLYKFWVYDKQKNEWTIIRDYNSKNTFSYAIQEPGQYSLVVHTKHRLSKKAYDDRAEVIVNITEKIYSSSSTSLIVEGERYAGNKLSLKASANPASDTLYKFWVYDKQKNEWTIIRDYNSKNTFSYAIQEPGQYSLVVHTKHRLSKKAYDDRAEVIVTIKDLVDESKAISLEVKGDLVRGNTITLKGSATPEDATLYKFWIYDSYKNEWTVLRDYSKSNEINYVLKDSGRFSFVIHVKHINSKNAYDDRYEIVKDVTTVKPQIRGVDISGIKKVGETVDIKVEANSTEQLEYKFLIKDKLTNQWRTIKDYSDSNVIQYKLTNPGTFTISINVRRKSQKGVSYEEYIHKNLLVKQDKLIVVDAGHGATDPGAIYYHGGVKYSEDVINMSIALKLEQKLKAAGYNVVMTRNPMTSGFVSLNRRAEISNYLNADLFISIHQNSAGATSANGVEVYYSTKSVDEDVRSYLIESGHDNPDNTLAKRIQNSEKLSTIVVGNISKNIGSYNRGSKIAGFYVNRNTEATSILVECGFISNASEAKKLSQQDTQYKIAQSILDGVNETLK